MIVAPERSSAPVERVMAHQAQRPAVARHIEPARRARDDVMTFQFFFAAASLAAPTVTTKDIGSQLAPAPRGSAPGY